MKDFGCAYCLLPIALCFVVAAHRSLLTAHFFMLSFVATPGWRNGRRYGLKIR